MAKLSMPVTSIEDNTNKIDPVTVEYSGGGSYTAFTGGVHSFYPSIQTAIDIAHPVGSIMCMSSNTNPSELYGGTWELVDKGLKTRWHDFSAEGGWTASNATLTTFGNTASGARIGGNTMSIRLHLLTTTALSDSTITLGAVNPTSLGLTQLPNDWKYVPFSFDGGGVLDVVGTTCLTIDGWLTVEDIWTATANGASHAYASGSNLAFIYHYSGIPHTYMLDSACDRFYFKRTA